MQVRITGTGLAVPERVQTAAELSPLVGRSERWILSRTGVAERRVCEGDHIELAAEAARLALGDGGPPDLLLNASLSPQQLIPDTSVFVAKALGLSGITTWSVHATCLSTLPALQQASALILAGAYRRVLIVAAEHGTRSRDMSHPESAVLIGDGAGAMLVEATPDGEASEILAVRMRAFPEGSHLAEFRGGGVRCHPNDPATTEADNLFRMNGPALYRMTWRRAEEVLDALFEDAGLTRDDVDLVIPHQASGPALAALPRFGFPEDKVVNLIPQYGNCIAASLPMALATAHASGRLQRGQTVLLLGTGAGLHVAGVLLRW